MSDTSVDNVNELPIEEDVEPYTTTNRIVTGVVVAVAGAAITFGMVKLMERRDARRAAKMAEEIHVVTDLEDKKTPAS
jgi:hypothetical protein